VSLTVSYGSLVSFLSDRVDRDRRPTAEPTGLCLVAGGIVGSNLDETLRRHGIPPDKLAITTIESAARRLVESHHRRTASAEASVDVCDPQLAQQLLLETITTSETAGSEAVEALLADFDWAGRPTLTERLWRELDRYFRMTDAGRDVEAARAVARELAADNPYAAHRSLRALDAFETLHARLEDQTEPLGETVYLSRSHLVSAARRQLAVEWTECFPAVEWVTLDTVAVLDNPTLRFFETLAGLEEGPDVYVFGSEHGAGPRLYDRLASTGHAVKQTTGETAAPSHVTALLETVDGTPPDSIPNTTFVEAPDARRELAAVASRIRELTGMADAEATTTCGEIVIAAKDAIPYRNRIEAVFGAHGIPVHVQARRPLMQTVPYRYLTAVCGLLAAAETDKPVTPQALVDPLRLGFVPPESAQQSSEWPLAGQRVADIEAWLKRLAPSTISEDGQPITAWAETVRAASTAAEWPAIHALIEWVESTESTPPDSKTTVVDRIVDLLDAYSAPLAGDGVRRTQGPGIDDTRGALTRTHDSRIVDRLRREADHLGGYIEGAVATDIASYCWQDLTEALRAVCGGASYWPRLVDGNAVRVVNAANAHYLDVEYVFVVGLGAEEFPATRSPPTLFHEAFYTAVAADSAAESSARNYLHAPTADSQFETDVEEFRAAISAADTGVRLCRQYTDGAGERIAWSGFVDAYTATAGDDIQRITVDEWVSTPHDTPQELVRTATPRERLGLLCGTFPDGLSTMLQTRQSTAGLVDREAISTLLSAADGMAYNQEIEPRRRRYSGVDLSSITVQPDEPIYDGTSSSQLLAAATKAPTRTHELDLYATCQLKYYWYQYLGGYQHRDAIPADDDRQLPHLLGERYPDSELDVGLRRLITSPERLADRQSAFDAFDSLGAFRDQLTTWIDCDPALSERLMQPMLGEYQAVQYELEADIDREWRWEPSTVVYVGGHELSVPGHRVDTLGTHGLSVPVWYTRQPGAAVRLVDRSLAATTPVTERDHRLLAGSLAVEPFGGTLVYDPTSSAASAPAGVVVGDLNPIPDAVAEATNLRQLSRSAWTDRRTAWVDSSTAALGEMSEVDTPTTYRSSESFVSEGGCDGCVYRGLCGVPASHREDR